MRAIAIPIADTEKSVFIIPPFFFRFRHSMELLAFVWPFGNLGVIERERENKGCFFLLGSKFVSYVGLELQTFVLCTFFFLCFLVCCFLAVLRLCVKEWIKEGKEGKEGRREGGKEGRRERKDGGKGGMEGKEGRREGRKEGSRVRANLIYCRCYCCCC